MLLIVVASCCCKQKPGTGPGFLLYNNWKERAVLSGSGGFAAALRNQFKFGCSGWYDVNEGRLRLCCFHAANFTRSKWCHALGRIENLAATVEADLIGLGLKREGTRLPTMATAKNQLIEKTKDRRNCISYKTHVRHDPQNNIVRKCQGTCHYWCR